MLITIPKLTVQNKYQETAIFTDKVHGFEPTKIRYNGYVVEGVKVYTPEGQFKVLASPVEFAAKLAFSKKSGESVNVLPLYKNGSKMLDVATVNAKVKMLNAGGK